MQFVLGILWTPLVISKFWKILKQPSLLMTREAYSGLNETSVGGIKNSCWKNWKMLELCRSYAFATFQAFALCLYWNGTPSKIFWKDCLKFLDSYLTKIFWTTACEGYFIWPRNVVECGFINSKLNKAANDTFIKQPGRRFLL